MSDNEVNNEKSNEESSKEIVIEINGEENVKDNNEDDILNKAETKFVEQKQVSALTEEERNLILSNAKAGIDQPYYEVKTFKNGKQRIIKKKTVTPTVSQKAIKTTPSPTNAEQKVYYSDNQLLFEHIIELNAKVDKLMTKHKKLKRRYQALQNDIYVDDEEFNELQGKAHEVEEPVVSEGVEAKTNEEQKEQVKNQPNAYVQPVSTRGWRSRLTYL